jgi:hypothetical protein
VDIEQLIGVLQMVKKEPVDLSMFDRTWLLSNKSIIIHSKGSEFVDYKILDLDRIYAPPASDRNKARAEGLDEPNVQDLEQALLNGINFGEKPMVVRWNPQVIDGESYDWELICGNHRFEALTNLNQTQYYFAVYKFGVSGVKTVKAIYDFQLVENNHSPRKSSTELDVINVGSRLIDQKLLNNDEESIRSWVNTVCSNKANTTRGKIISAILQANGVHQDITTFTTKGAYNWIKKNTNFTVAGKVDVKRNQHGWTVKEGYEYEYIMNAVKKFAQTGKESYFVCHAKAPTATMSLHDKREKIMDTFETLDDSLTQVVEFYNENGRFPWHVEGHMAQDHGKKEKGVIKL